MKKIIAIIGACAIGLAPAAALGAPGSPNGTATGWVHLNGPAAGSTGQPGASCELTGPGTTPGNRANAQGTGSPFLGDASNAGSHYAGEQAQNQRNNQSVSQYDVACQNQLNRISR